MRREGFDPRCRRRDILNNCNIDTCTLFGDCSQNDERAVYRYNIEPNKDRSSGQGDYSPQLEIHHQLLRRSRDGHTRMTSLRQDFIDRPALADDNYLPIETALTTIKENASLIYRHFRMHRHPDSTNSTLQRAKPLSTPSDRLQKSSQGRDNHRPSDSTSPKQSRPSEHRKAAPADESAFHPTGKRQDISSVSCASTGDLQSSRRLQLRTSATTAKASPIPKDVGKIMPSVQSTPINNQPLMTGDKSRITDSSEEAPWIYRAPISEMSRTPATQRKSLPKSSNEIHEDFEKGALG